MAQYRLTDFRGGVRVIGSVDWSPDDWDYQTSDAEVERVLGEMEAKGEVTIFTFLVWHGKERDMASPLNDPKLEALLDRLHAQSDAQVTEIDAYFARRDQEGTLDKENRFDDHVRGFYADKMVALDRDKAEFCYQLCRSLRATRVVEAGTSFGVSTLYLAAAVRDNRVENGLVIGTEYEPEKSEVARANFKGGGAKRVHRTARRRPPSDAPRRRWASGLHAGRHLGSSTARP